MSAAIAPPVPAPADAPVPRRILPAILLAQVACTSLWFSANAVLPELQRAWDLPADTSAWLASGVNAGFILGTLVFALLAIADRYPARHVFLACAVLGAASNVAVLFVPPSAGALIVLRVATGFFIAGIYPVGMKIAASWYARGLGTAMGFLIGALVLGTSLPWGLRATGTQWAWQSVIAAVSVIVVGGGLLLWTFVPEGPHARRAARIDPRALAVIVRDPKVRASAFGYFGHMWELYAMIVAVPALVARYLRTSETPGVAAIAFVVIAAGGVGCAVGGLLTRRFGSARVAAVQLAISGCCCLLIPWMFQAPWWAFLPFLVVWGITVAGDSPQFSTLTALNAPPQSVGSVLTFVNCIGFTITIVGIQTIAWLSSTRPLESVLPWLAAGPALGLWAMWPLVRARPA